MGGADNTALSKPPPESLGAGAGGAGARGCRHGAGARGLRGGPCQHPASSQPSPSPSAEGRGLLSASQLPAGILGCNELLRSQASTWQRWVVFALEQRTPKEEGGGAAAGGHPLPAETAAAPRPSPATSWLGLSGVAMLAFRWHQGWVVPPGSSRRNSNRPAKFFFSPSFFPSKMLPPF